jgi:hypothetical protein
MDPLHARIHDLENELKAAHDALRKLKRENRYIEPSTCGICFSLIKECFQHFDFND